MQHNFLDVVDTEEKAYFLGFFIADGHALDPKWKRYRIQISCCDRDIIEKLAKVIAYDGEIRINHGERKKPQILLRFHSRGIWKSLDEMGLVGKKSYLVSYFPQIMVERKLQRHFIRGLVDGDGHVGCKTLKSKGWRNDGVSLVSASWDLIDGVRGILNNVTKRRAKVEVRQLKTGRAFYRLSYAGSSAYRVAKFLYEGATIYMQRKMDIYKQLREVYRTCPVETERRMPKGRHSANNLDGRKHPWYKLQSELAGDSKSAGCTPAKAG